MIRLAIISGLFIFGTVYYAKHTGAAVEMDRAMRNFSIAMRGLGW